MWKNNSTKVCKHLFLHLVEISPTYLDRPVILNKWWGITFLIDLLVICLIVWYTDSILVRWCCLTSQIAGDSWSKKDSDDTSLMECEGPDTTSHGLELGVPLDLGSGASTIVQVPQHLLPPIVSKLPSKIGTFLVDWMKGSYSRFLNMFNISFHVK